MKPKTTKNPRGAGAPNQLVSPRFVRCYLDQQTIDIMLTLGEGNRSKGIRKAAQIVLQYQKGIRHVKK